MYSLRLRLACYSGLAFAGLVLVLLVARRTAPALQECDAYCTALIQIGRKHAVADSARFDSAKVQVVHDSVTVTRAVTRYATLRDTLNIHDTVQVIAFRDRSDSLKRSCSELVVSCSVLRQRADSVIGDQRVEITALRLDVQRLTPSRWDRAKEWGVRGLIAYGAYTLGKAGH